MLILTYVWLLKEEASTNATGAGHQTKSFNTTISLYKINFFSEYGHVLYQIKGNDAYNNILANSLPLHTPIGFGKNVFVSFQ